MGEPRAVVVPLRRDEDLRLVLEAPKSLGGDDAVAVALERRSVSRVLRGALRGGGVRARWERRQPLLLELLDALAERRSCCFHAGHPGRVSQSAQPDSMAACAAATRAIGTRYGEQ